MTTNTEALRAQFESDFPPEKYSHRRAFAGSHGYWYSHTNKAWIGYQAGYAAGVAAERERCANLAADLAADACVAYANGEPMSFREMVGDAIRAAKEGGA